MDNIDILYYDSMLESVIEDRKIMELTMGSRIEMMLNESSNELAIYEAGILNTILDVIKKLFERVIQFIKDIIAYITRKNTFKPNKELIVNEGIELDKTGLIKLDENSMTNLEGVFAGGDVSQSKATVCKAIYSGREAAKRNR